MKELAKILKVIFPLACLLMVWQLLGMIGILNPVFVPTPLVLLGDFSDLLSSGGIWLDVAQSVKRVLIGFVLASSVAITLGVVCGMNKRIFNI